MLLMANVANPTAYSFGDARWSSATASCGSHGAVRRASMATEITSASSPAAGCMEASVPTSESEGMALFRRLLALEDAGGGDGDGERLWATEGSRVWIKMAGYCHWPAVVFSLRNCRKSEVPDLLASYQPGRTLVHFYGTHDHAWAGLACLSAWTTDTDARLTALKAASKSSKAAAATLAELSDSRGAKPPAAPARELARMVRLRDAARGCGGGGGGSGALCSKKGLQARCSGCGEDGTQVTCEFCRKSFHTLCLPQPDVSPTHMLAAALAALEAQPAQLEAPIQKHQQPQPCQAQQQQQQQQLLTAMWTCSACGRPNQIQGPMPQSRRLRTAAAVTGAHVSTSTEPQGGRRRGLGTAPSSSAGGSSAVGSPMGPPAGHHRRQQQQQMPPQQHVLQHDELLALYERLLADDVAVEAAAAAAAAAQTARPGPQQADTAAEEPVPVTDAVGATGGEAGGLDASAGVLLQSAGTVATATRQTCRAVPGTRLWVKTPGYCHWPAVVFSLRHCRKSEVPDLLATYQPGHTLLHFYGEHNHMWLLDEEVAALAAVAAEPREEEERRAELVAWSSRRKNSRLLPQQTAQSLPSASRPFSPSQEILRVMALRDTRLAEAEERREAEAWEQLTMEGFVAARTEQGAAGLAGSAAGAGCWRTGEAGIGSWRSCLRVCAACEQLGGQVCCTHCRRAYHTLCLTPRWLSPAYMPPRQPWTCGSCGGRNEASSSPSQQQAGSSSSGRSADGGPTTGTLEEERLGLTPDWVIVAGAFKVFQLPRPTATFPYIRGLLDPCTNSKANPNIPAEKLYDKEDDGLRLSNSWAGYNVILNPEYTSQTQWRFVNRAIDEVENGSVPAVILLCRNSTDTAYFQRLRPYPRVMLKRTSARFKDYEKTPIGFGIAVFCIAPQGPGRLPLYRRFIDAFGAWGEPNIPIDSAFVDSPAFSELLDRLADHTTRTMRDTWVQCSACRRWRIVPYDVYRRLEDRLARGQEQDPQELQIGSDGRDGAPLSSPGEGGKPGDDGEQRTPAGTWTCSQLGAGSSCQRPQSRFEAAGVHYARQRSSQRSGQRSGGGDAARDAGDFLGGQALEEPLLPRRQGAMVKPGATTAVPLEVAGGDVPPGSEREGELQETPSAVPEAVQVPIEGPVQRADDGTSEAAAVTDTAVMELGARSGPAAAVRSAMAAAIAVAAALGPVAEAAAAEEMASVARSTVEAAAMEPSAVEGAVVVWAAAAPVGANGTVLFPDMEPGV
ncbi:hypothetical protein PLESTM_001144900 [Pleodorina starrii]|nr:hypothetical protein PLESTM_001144900 [Pleodorina starrii]